MRTKYPLETQSCLQEAAAKFSRWRTTRKPRSAFPRSCGKPPWTLHPPYSTHHIARALRLNYTDLKRRIGKRPPEEHAAEFIEIHMRQLLPTAPCVLELRCPKGFELKIHDFDRIQP